MCGGMYVCMYVCMYVIQNLSPSGGVAEGGGLKRLEALNVVETKLEVEGIRALCR